MDIFLTQSAKHFKLRSLKYKFVRFSSNEIKISTSPTISACIIVCCLRNDHDLIELLLLANALKTTKITLIITYLFYTRDDKNVPHSSFGLQVITNLIEQCNFHNIYILDPHCNLFSINNTEFSAFELFINDITKNNTSDSIIIAPDKGIFPKASRMAANLNFSLVRCTKIRSATSIKTVIHGNVFQKKCILVDDIIDSYGTIESAALALQEQGASSISCYCTHGVLSPGSVQRIQYSPVSEVVITDSIFGCPEVAECDKIRVISIKPLLQSIIDGML